MFDTTNTKKVLQSKAVWFGIGAVIAGLIEVSAAVATVLGHPVDPATTETAKAIAGQVVDTAATAAAVGLSPDLLIQLGAGLFAMLGGTGAIHGRITATQRIG
jgi:hypothetical protein